MRALRVLAGFKVKKRAFAVNNQRQLHSLQTFVIYVELFHVVSVKPVITVWL